MGPYRHFKGLCGGEVVFRCFNVVVEPTVFDRDSDRCVSALVGGGRECDATSCIWRCVGDGWVRYQCCVATGRGDTQWLCVASSRRNVRQRDSLFGSIFCNRYA